MESKQETSEENNTTQLDQVQKQVEELKVNVSEQPNTNDFDPWLDLKDILDDLKVDYKSPDFKEESLVEMFEKLGEDKEIVWWKRKDYKDLAVILKQHRFWTSEPIMLYNKRMTKSGEIRTIKPEEIPDEPLPLPPGFEWAAFDPFDDA